MNKLELSILLISFATVMTCGTFAGYSYARDTIQPTIIHEVVTETKYITQEVPVVLEKTVYRDVPATLEPQEFKDTREALRWIAHYLGERPPHQYIRNKYDCEDFAIDMACAALCDNKLAIAYSVIQGSTNHHFVVFPIGGNLWKVEPQAGVPWMTHWTHKDF